MNCVLSQAELAYHLNESLILACQSSDTPLSTIKSILAHPLTNPTCKENSALIKASKSGCLETVKLLLSKIDNIPPKVFYWPCVDGRTEIIELLLKDGRPDPGFFNTQSCIKLASKFGNVEAVRLLLQDTRVDPSIDYNNPLRDAAIRGHAGVIDLLLNHPRVNPADRDNFAIRAASLHGHYDCVKLLINDSRVDPSAEDCEALKWAKEKNHLEIVDLLLSDRRVRELADIYDLTDEFSLVEVQA